MDENQIKKEIQNIERQARLEALFHSSESILIEIQQSLKEQLVTDDAVDKFLMTSSLIQAFQEAWSKIDESTCPVCQRIVYPLNQDTLKTKTWIDRVKKKWGVRPVHKECEKESRQAKCGDACLHCDNHVSDGGQCEGDTHLYYPTDCDSYHYPGMEEDIANAEDVEDDF